MRITVNISNYDSEFIEGMDEVICLTDIPDDLALLVVNEGNTVLKTTTTMRWNGDTILHYKRETELKEK